MYCSACRSVFSATDPACYACGADAATAVPFEPSGPVRPFTRAQLADTSPPAGALPPAPGRLERAILEVQPATLGLLVLGVVAMVLALFAAAVALGPDAGLWLAAVIMAALAIALPVVGPRIAGADTTGLILRYELLLAVIAVMLAAGWMLPAEIRWPLLAVASAVAIAMGRARAR